MPTAINIRWFPKLLSKETTLVLTFADPGHPDIRPKTELTATRNFVVWKSISMKPDPNGKEYEQFRLVFSNDLGFRYDVMDNRNILRASRKEAEAEPCKAGELLHLKASQESEYWVKSAEKDGNRQRATNETNSPKWFTLGTVNSEGYKPTFAWHLKPKTFADAIFRPILQGHVDVTNKAQDGQFFTKDFVDRAGLSEKPLFRWNTEDAPSTWEFVELSGGKYEMRQSSADAPPGDTLENDDYPVGSSPEQPSSSITRKIIKLDEVKSEHALHIPPLAPGVPPTPPPPKLINSSTLPNPKIKEEEPATVAVNVTWPPGLEKEDVSKIFEHIERQCTRFSIKYTWVKHDRRSYRTITATRTGASPRDLADQVTDIVRDAADKILAPAFPIVPVPDIERTVNIFDDGTLRVGGPCQIPAESGKVDLQDLIKQLIALAIASNPALSAVADLSKSADRVLDEVSEVQGQATNLQQVGASSNERNARPSENPTNNSTADTPRVESEGNGSVNQGDGAAGSNGTNREAASNGTNREGGAASQPPTLNGGVENGEQNNRRGTGGEGLDQASTGDFAQPSDAQSNGPQSGTDLVREAEHHNAGAGQD